MDKRKQNRLQGGCQKQGVMKTKKASTKSEPPMGDSSQFTYDPNVAASIVTDVPVEVKPMDIVDKGLYDLGKDQSGVSARVNYMKDFLSKKEADDFLDYFKINLPWQQRRGLNKGNAEYSEPRMTCWFGKPYNYSSVKWEANTDWNVRLKALCEKISSCLGVEFDSVFCNLYRNNKDSIGWHADDEPSLGRHPTIASVTLGCERPFELAPKKLLNKGADDSMKVTPTHRIFLHHGSLLVMEGSMQDLYIHRVPKEYHDKEPRINLTFRVIKNPPKESYHLPSHTDVSLESGSPNQKHV